MRPPMLPGSRVVSPPPIDEDMLEALLGALDSRDRETEGHSRRVLEYTGRLARELRLTEPDWGAVRRGALIHDIGKISTPDAILNKPGSLDPAERRVMERHPLVGYEMLYGIPRLADALCVVLAHHERWDGSGYPHGLAGTAIPLPARVFAVADTFDAITSDRPYRPGRPCPEALGVIAAERGRQFDPAVVDAFLHVPASEWEAIRGGVVVTLARRRETRQEEIRCSVAALLGSGPGPVEGGP
jgi:putative nucleotidyltransferase with HDIG domain